MTESLFHPNAEQLEAYVEGTLSEGERAVVDSHVLNCPACEAELEEWQSLFSALASMPQLAPAATFADHVMAKVQVKPQSVAIADRIGGYLTKLMPKTALGWSFAAGLVAVPSFVTIGVIAWLASHPWITPSAVLLFMSEHAGSYAAAAIQTGQTWLFSSPATMLFVKLAREMSKSADAAKLGAAAGLFATMTVLSVWVLYRNLFSVKTRKANYALHSF